MRIGSSLSMILLLSGPNTLNTRVLISETGPTTPWMNSSKTQVTSEMKTLPTKIISPTTVWCTKTYQLAYPISIDIFHRRRVVFDRKRYSE